MNRLISISAAAAFFLGPLFASAAEPQSCHEQHLPLPRLLCYDKSTGYTPPEQGAPGKAIGPASDVKPSSETVDVEDKGVQWNLSTQKSEMDGRSDVWLRLESENTQPNQIEDREHATLWIRCMQNKTNLLVTFNDYVSEGQQVRYKLDDQNPKSIRMEDIKGGDGIGVFSGAESIALVREFYGKKRLVIAYRSFGNMNLEFTFDIAGLKARIGPVAESCGWKP
ncbi:type VI secretion system-associated protein TagO [Paracoccus litorisediminis]|uniref:type VI secretion system-associated protein TagO n=1 Tax=Paracoccus litorisediminis TaxID=2006130 RepID=UPI00372DB60E